MDHADQELEEGIISSLRLHEGRVYFGWHNKQLRDEVSHIAQRVHTAISLCR